jgi:hypothetical protein
VNSRPAPDRKMDVKPKSKRDAKKEVKKDAKKEVKKETNRRSGVSSSRTPQKKEGQDGRRAVRGR